MSSPGLVAETRRLRVATPAPFVAWVLLLLLQLIVPSNAWSWPLVGLGVLLAFSYYWARMLRDRVTATRRVLGTWVVAGDELAEEFTLNNTGKLPVLWARVVDHSEVPGYSAERVESAGPGTSRSWTYMGRCQRRGAFRLGPWDLQMADPLGFFEVAHSYPLVTTINVYPRPSHLPDFELPRGRATGRAASRERSPLETITVAELRDYAPGDSLRRVHWPATAHHDRLMVREFDREPTGDVWLVVDMDAGVQAGAEGEATTEYAVTLAASLAAQLARQGERRAVGLLVTGRHPALLPPARGPAQVWRILGALTAAEPDASRSLASLLHDFAGSLGSGRTVVLITPSQDAAWVAALLPLVGRGNAPVALLLDATTFTPPQGTPPGLAGLRGLLADQRIPNYVLAQGFPFRPIEPIRRRRRELQALGTGRVVAREVEEEV